MNHDAVEFSLLLYVANTLRNLMYHLHSARMSDGDKISPKYVTSL